MLARLNCRVEVYDLVFDKTEIVASVEYSLVKRVWADIKPIKGSLEKYEGHTEYPEVSYKFTIRKNALKNINENMHFIYGGQKYEIEYFIPNYKYKDTYEIFCRLSKKEGVSIG